MKIIFYTGIFIGLLSFSSCEKTDIESELMDNPKASIEINNKSSKHFIKTKSTSGRSNVVDERFFKVLLPDTTKPNKRK